jgi:SnoaL-like polyketide cyclase
MIKISMSEAAKAVVRRNTEEVQGGGNFEVFEELFADDFIDHTPQPGRTPDKAGARELYKVLRIAFPDFHANIHWQLADGDRVTTYKTYHGTHKCYPHTALPMPKIAGNATAAVNVSAAAPARLTFANERHDLLRRSWKILRLTSSIRPPNHHVNYFRTQG